MKNALRKLVWLITITVGVTAGAALAPPTSPKRVLIIGDSMMHVTAHSLELTLAGRTGVTTRAFTSLGSGLARLDAFDWIAKIQALLAEFDPDATVAWFGTNDRQPMQTADGVIRIDQPEWETEYARRVGVVMDLLTTHDAARVCWLELPDMRNPEMQKEVQLINDLVRAESGKRERVEFISTRKILARHPGKFSPYIIGPNGMPVQVRDADGVHLNRTGADLLADYLADYLYGQTTNQANIEK